MLKKIFAGYVHIPLVARVLIAFALGAVLGVWASYMPETSTAQINAIVKPFGDVLISLLKMVVFPIVFFSLVLGAASLPLKKSGKLGVSVLAWYFATSVFATLFGVVLAMAFNPQMASFAETASKFQGEIEQFRSTSGGSTGFGTFFTSLFTNPFQSLAEGHFLGIVVFSVIVGLAARFLLDSAKTPKEEQDSISVMLKVAQGCQAVSFKIIDWVMEYFPIGILALSYTNFSASGVDLFGPYLRIIACVVCGTLAMIFVIYPLAILIFCRENPYRVLSKMRLPILTAFTTRSSAATLSVSMKTAQKIGVSPSLSSFSLPLGCTVNMDGVCVHLPVFVILGSNLFNVPLTTTGLVALLVSVVFASIGAGGVPGGSVFLLFMILENAGFTPPQIGAIVGLALGVNPILDMFETACNVTGDNICTYIVAKLHKMLSPGGQETDPS